MAEKSRIEELSAAIRYHRELYYNHSAPEISDAEFDRMYSGLMKTSLSACEPRRLRKSRTVALEPGRVENFEKFDGMPKGFLD